MSAFAFLPAYSPIFYEDKTYWVISGGRASGKSTNIAAYFLMKLMGKEELSQAEPKPDFEINPDHPIIQKLDGLRRSDAVLAKQVGVQLLENAMVAAGLTEDPRAMLGRLNQLLEKLLPSN